MYVSLGFSEKMVDVLRLNFPSEIGVAFFGTMPGDVLGTDDAARFTARKIHGHIILGSTTLLK